MFKCVRGATIVLQCLPLIGILLKDCCVEKSLSLVGCSSLSTKLCFPVPSLSPFLTPSLSVQSLPHVLLLELVTLLLVDLLKSPLIITHFQFLFKEKTMLIVYMLWIVSVFLMFMCIQVYRGQNLVSFLRNATTFLRHDIFIDLESQVDWPVRPQGTALLCFPSSGVAGPCHSAWLFMQVLGTELGTLRLLETVSALSQCTPCFQFHSCFMDVLVRN